MLARRHKDKWYVVGVNANDKALVLKVNLPMFASKTVSYFSDDKSMSPFKKEIKIKKTDKFELSIQPNGGVILTDF